ncbi:MAG: GNAT family N-acetyltransferase [Deltaproteobacteria bacterium]|nr:GNAT family N-acetyltransferase [Deltaproteobacteria bacterium]
MREKAIIRKGRLQDVPALVELLKELFTIEKDFEFDQTKQKAGLKMFLDKESDERIILVAELDGEVIGMCSAQTLISTAEGARSTIIEDMVVKDGFRGQGVGKQIMDEIIAWTKSSGITRLQLLADKNNSRAIWFYRKNLWENTQLICLRRKMI